MDRRKFLIAGLLTLFRRRGTRNSYSAPSQFTGTAQQVAQQKANLQAARGYWFHPGGGYGGGYAEGVGSGSTPQQALNNCCRFRGRVIGAATAYSERTGRYYACKLYGR